MEALLFEEFGPVDWFFFPQRNPLIWNQMFSVNLFMSFQISSPSWPLRTSVFCVPAPHLPTISHPNGSPFSLFSICMPPLSFFYSPHNWICSFSQNVFNPIHWPSLPIFPQVCLIIKRRIYFVELPLVDFLTPLVLLCFFFTRTPFCFPF